MSTHLRIISDQRPAGSGEEGRPERDPELGHTELGRPELGLTEQGRTCQEDLSTGPLPFLTRRRPRLADDTGAVTAEYAIVIMAAVAFAGLLVAIMRSSEIRAMLVQLVENALGAAG